MPLSGTDGINHMRDENRHAWDNKNNVQGAHHVRLHCWK
jgi:hypothetical protein